MTQQKTIMTLLGPTGSGKDTQADLLANNYGFTVIKIGRLIRALAETNTNIAQSIQKGELADDQTVNKLVAEQITTNDSTDKILLDGYPRHIDQAIWLDDHLKKNGLALSKAIYIDVPDDEVRRRLALRGRADDVEQNITERLEIFHRETVKVIAYYKRDARLARIDGSGSVEEIYQRIEAVL
ncbi:nucleoside monophosphate kinase [bacterium]|nr:nucleoside monophosphate kinase [bacterium]